ncbi:hypothetical protein TetV_275 [Tetraselmis virus 1]|uniref:Uncharacterized protein n=1 Tax=Tetraselmis virus 1 TaxID=2060617 RepID=A0A2P0VN79_9VIRU|nr:hypothetical protein QJ968_gp275 [Tetraselmis virus 1]AUF82367.1 hypothetical protein TetV_275 [Tetraselmis virus 1]
MDSVCEQRLSYVKQETKKSVKYVPLSIYDEQLSGRTLRKDFTNMFYSSGPWQFRDNAYGLPGDFGDLEGADLYDKLSRERDNLSKSNNFDNLAAERKKQDYIASQNRISQNNAHKYSNTPLQLPSITISDKNIVGIPETSPDAETFVLAANPLKEKLTPAQRIKNRRLKKINA